MRLKILLVIVPLILVSACSYVSPRYTTDADTTIRLRQLQAGSVGVGAFSEPESLDMTCRAAGALDAPDGLTYGQFIQKALADELKVAGIYAASAPRVSLSGELKELSFSSTYGHWILGLKLNSTNGQSMDVHHQYEFSTSFIAEIACQRAADAFVPAVQDTIKKAVSSPDFARLIR